MKAFQFELKPIISISNLLYLVEPLKNFDYLEKLTMQFTNFFNSINNYGIIHQSCAFNHCH